MATALLRNDVARACAGTAPAEAVLLAAFPHARVPVVAATACLVPFLLDPAAVLMAGPPGHVPLQRLGLAAAFLVGVSSGVCTRQPPSASVLARVCLPA